MAARSNINLLNLPKCSDSSEKPVSSSGWRTKVVRYLGHIVSPEGITTNPEKLKNFFSLTNIPSYYYSQIILGTVVLSHHITRYSHTLTHIHIVPQNSRHWPLWKSPNVGTDAGNTAEKYLQQGPVWFPFVAVMPYIYITTGFQC
jgi:hypothetical protein